MKRFLVFLIGMLAMSPWLRAQCDAAFIPSHWHAVTGSPVHFLYWGEVVYAGTGYTIDFGNGSNSSGASPVNNKLGTVTYASPGIYTVTVTVNKTTVPTCSVSYSSTIEVVAPGCAPASPSLFDDPIVTNDIYTLDGCIDEAKTFTVDYNGSGTLSHVEWNMGDGTIITTTGTTLTYTWSDGGKYFVTARLVETSGCSDYAKVPIAVGSSDYIHFYCVKVGDPDVEITLTPTNPVVGDNVTFTYTGDPSLFAPGYVNSWMFSVNIDNGGWSAPAALSSGMTLPGITSISPAGLHSYAIDVYGIGTCRIKDTLYYTVSQESCDTCNSFKPIPGETYWISAWVQKESAAQVASYTDVSITLGFVNGTPVSQTLYPTGEVIDGWQRIAGKFTIPSGTTDLEVKLNAGNNITYFDDIRIHPFNGSMKSYVYDGTTFWLVAELDDNNYATFYEYDAEGGLVRIKKETSGGIVTIQETRSNTVKISTP